MAPLITRFATREDLSRAVMALEMFSQARVCDEALGTLVARKWTLAVVTQDVGQKVGLLDEPVDVKSCNCKSVFVNSRVISI